MKSENDMESNEYGLRVLQLATVETLVMFDRLCKKNGLVYYLGFGTLLGAVRHKGYIPWDDDVDLCMPREDYDRFLCNIYLQVVKPFSVCHFSMDNYSSYSCNIRIENKKVKLGRDIGGEKIYFPSWISIFPIDGMPKGKVNQILHEKHVSYLYALLRFARSSIKGYGSTPKSTKERIGVMLNNIFCIGKLFSPRKVAMKIDNCLKKYKYANSDLACIYTYDRYQIDYQKEWFGEPNNLDFEHLSLPCPSNYKSFLKQCYKNYMELPPKNKRKPSHSIDIIVERDV